MSTTGTVDWSAFAGKMKLSEADIETSFNDAVGGAYFDPGIHVDVTIKAVEAKVSKAGNPYFSISLADDSGAMIRSNVMWTTDADNQPHFTVSRLGRATVADRATRGKLFGSVFAENPQLLDGLKGIKVTIKIEEGKEGYLVRKDTTSGELMLIDAETQKPYPEFEDLSTTDYKTVKETADEAGLQRCYNEVKNITRGTDDATEANEKIIQAILHAAETGTNAAAKPKAAAIRSMV